MGCASKNFAQFILTGTVYDSTRINFVEGVRVESNAGKFTYTDSMGKYNLQVTEADSVVFTFRNKPTQKFAVKTIPNPTNFDIWIHVKVKGKFTTLKEVIVRANSYRQDSVENRRQYEDVFNYRTGKVGTSIVPGGGVGFDINDLINLFRFRRNKQLKAFRNRLELEEKERYVNYRFNKTLVTRITGLKSAALDTFMVRYRPDYEFVQLSDELSFNEYIINAWYHYKMEMLKPTLPNLQKN
jgi:hypothetical protein